ncbi:MAG: flippase [Candidatus Methanoperedens sp.]|nr:flippase [Candidatus Methanoperedens sp.]
MSVIRIIKNISALALGEFITRILSLILIIYLARYLGDVGFGRYSFAFAFTSLFLVLVDPGVNSLVIRDVARDKTLTSRYMGNILLLRLILSSIAFVFIVGVINLMDYPRDTKLVVYIVGVYGIMTSFSQLTRSVFRAFEKMEYEALLNIIERLVFVSLGIVVLLLGYGLIEVVSVFLVAGVANIILSFFLTAKKFATPKLELDFKLWKYLIREGLPFGLALIFITVYMKINTVMLSVMKGDAVVGWYNAAYQIPLAVSLISFAFMEAIFPTLSRLHESSTESLIYAYEKSFKFSSIIILPIALSITLLSEKIILILYGKLYASSIVVLQILVWFTVFEFLSYLLYVTLASINRQRLNTLSTGICAALNILLNLILIPSYSFIGAGIATVITYVALFSMNFYFVSKYLCKISIIKAMNKPIIATLAMGFILYPLRDMNILVTIPLAGLFYILSLYLIKGLTKDDIKLFYSP